MKKFKEESQKQSLDIKKILYKMKKRSIFFIYGYNRNVFV